MRDQWYTTPPPPEREHYLITDDSGEVQVAYWTNFSPILGDELSKMYHWVGLKQYTHVVAWRLLPEAYTGQRGVIE